MYVHTEPDNVIHVLTSKTITIIYILKPFFGDTLKKYKVVNNYHVTHFARLLSLMAEKKIIYFINGNT